jgi:hypothetical protein
MSKTAVAKTLVKSSVAQLSPPSDCVADQINMETKKSAKAVVKTPSVSVVLSPSTGALISPTTSQQSSPTPQSLSQGTRKTKSVGQSKGAQHITVGPNDRKYKLESLYKVQKFKEALAKPIESKDGTICSEGDCGQLIANAELDFHRRNECWYTIRTCDRCQRFQCPKRDLDMHKFVCQMLRYDDLPFLPEDLSAPIVPQTASKPD